MSGKVIAIDEHLDAEDTDDDSDVVSDVQVVVTGDSVLVIAYFDDDTCVDMVFDHRTSERLALHIRQAAWDVERVIEDAQHRGQATIPTAQLVWAMEPHRCND